MYQTYTHSTKAKQKYRYTQNLTDTPDLYFQVQSDKHNQHYYSKRMLLVDFG